MGFEWLEGRPEKQAAVAAIVEHGNPIPVPIVPQYVEQLIMVTDEGDNTAPGFVAALKRYRKALGIDPAVCFVRTPGAATTLEEDCQKAGIPADAFQFTGDYYALPNLIPMLARPSKLELLMEIMDYPLPERKPA